MYFITTVDKVKENRVALNFFYKIYLFMHIFEFNK